MEETLRNLKNHIRALCLEYPSRHAGSAGERASADYIEKYCRSLGYDVVSEYYPVRGWDYQSMEFRLASGETVPGATACYFSGPCGVKGKPFIVPAEASAHPEELEKLDVKGRLCFLMPFPGSVFARNKAAETLEKLGAAAAVFVTTGHTDAAPSSKFVRSPFINTIAAASVNCVGAAFILSHRDEEVVLTMDAHPYDTLARNVIARRGNGPKRGVLGAHFDASPLIQGAGDNASGTAILLELARVIDTFPEDYTIDFAAFSAEEYIPYDYPPGSGSYVRYHEKEDIRWLLNIDDYGVFFGNSQFAVGHGELLEGLKYPLPDVKATQSGDDKPFFHAGIPTVWLYQKKMFQYLHTACDTVETLDYPEMARGVYYMKEIYDQIIRLR